MKWMLLIFGLLSLIGSLLLLELMRVIPGAPVHFKLLDFVMGVSGIVAIVYGIKEFKKDKG